MTNPLPTLRGWLLAGLAALLFAAAVPAAQAQSDGIHVVERGDTLYELARRYGTSVDTLRLLNNLLDTDLLRVGQELRVRPDAAMPAPPSGSTRLAPAVRHTVEQGETLYSLARRYGSTVEELMRWNQLRDTNLRIGQDLLVRLSTVVAEGAVSDDLRPVPSAPPPASAPVTRGDFDSVAVADGGAGDVPEDAALPAPADPEPTDPDPADPDLADPDLADPPPADPPPPDPASEPSEAAPTASGTPPVPRPSAPPPATAPARGALSDADFADDDGGSAAPPPAAPPSVAALPPPRALQPAEVVQLGGAPRPFEITASTVPADEAHLVRRGETLYAVAARYQIPTQALVDANPGLTAAPLVAGQLLHLPAEVGTMKYHRTVDAELPPPDDTGEVLVYPDGLAGRRMASGVAYAPDAFVASHRTLPFGTVVLVTNPATERSAFVRVADRGPVSEQFAMELSSAAAAALGIDPDQTARVEIRRVR